MTFYIGSDITMLYDQILSLIVIIKQLELDTPRRNDKLFILSFSLIYCYDSS